MSSSKLISYLGQEPVIVIGRIKPLNENEKGDVLKLLNFNEVEYIDPKVNETITYNLSSIYEGTSTQREIFGQSISPSLNIIFDGGNFSLFTFGASGSGKSYTLQGTEKDHGLAYRILEFLFKHKAQNQLIQLDLSYFEIYLEKVYDLLKPSKTELNVLEDSEKSTHIQNLSQTRLFSLSQFQRLYKKGNENRHIGNTKVNQISSRSHGILQITVQYPISGKLHKSKVNIIDLSGNENSKKAETNGIRLTEACHINSSLLAINKVIKAIVTKESYIPYRDSKITRILSDSLGGSCKTVMLVTLSNNIEQYYQTKQSLEIAKDTMSVINQVKMNGYEIIESSKDVEEERKKRRNTNINNNRYSISTGRRSNSIISRNTSEKSLKRKISLIDTSTPNNNNNNKSNLKKRFKLDNGNIISSPLIPPSQPQSQPSVKRLSISNYSLIKSPFRECESIHNSPALRIRRIIPSQTPQNISMFNVENIVIEPEVENNEKEMKVEENETTTETVEEEEQQQEKEEVKEDSEIKEEKEKAQPETVSPTDVKQSTERLSIDSIKSTISINLNISQRSINDSTDSIIIPSMTFNRSEINSASSSASKHQPVTSFTRHKGNKHTSKSNGKENEENNNNTSNISVNKTEKSPDCRKSLHSSDFAKQKVNEAKEFIVKAREWEFSNNVALAIENYQKALQILPDHPGLQSKLKELSSTVAPKVAEVLKTDSSDKNEFILLNIINTGNIKQLMTLKQIGKKRAEQIINTREKEGLFTKIEDLTKAGITEKVLQSIISANS